MPPLPLLRPKDVIKVFQSFGFSVARRKGSHIVMIKKGHIATLSIPEHDYVARGTLRSLIQKAGITEESFLRKYYSQ
ncbi:MAG: type II toxin-antitoxin system HicA family toxin [Chloroflexota bacterium]